MTANLHPFASATLRLQVAGTINRGHDLVSYSRELIHEAQLRQQATRALLSSMYELRDFIRENRRDLSRTMGRPVRRTRMRSR